MRKRRKSFVPVKGKMIRLDVVFGNKVKRLSSVEFWLSHFKKVIKRLGLTYVKAVSKKFKSKIGGEGGVSAVCIILESHLSVHTWPEYNYAHIVLDSCKKDVDLNDFVKEVLKPFSKVKYKYIVKEGEWC